MRFQLIFILCFIFLSTNVEQNPYFDFESDTDSPSEPELTEEIILARLAPLSAKEAYTWGERNPAYRKIVGQSLSNDLSKYTFGFLL